jgi:hypothetical protein
MAIVKRMLRLASRNSINTGLHRERGQAVAQWLRHYDTSRKVEVSRPDEITNFFSPIYLILPAGLGPGVHSASNRNEQDKVKTNVSGE